MTVEEAATIEAIWAIDKKIAPEDVDALIASEHELRREVARLQAELKAVVAVGVTMACNAAKEEERERCAKVADSRASALLDGGNTWDAAGYSTLAAAIRGMK